MSTIPSEIYGNIISFLSLEDALNIIYNNTKLAPIILKYYPLDLSLKKVCTVFNKDNIRSLMYNINVGPDALLKCAINKFMYPLIKEILNTNKISILILNKALINMSLIGNLELVQLLLKKGADPSYKESKALFKGLSKPNIVKELLKNPKTNPNIKHTIYGDFHPGVLTEWYPLAYASYYNYTKTVDILLKYISKSKNKLDYKNKNYEDALYWAIVGKHLKIVDILLKYISKSKNKLDYKNKTYEDALYWAIVGKHLKIIKLLLRYIPKHINYNDILSIATNNKLILNVLLKSGKISIDKIHADLMFEQVSFIKKPFVIINILLQYPIFINNLKLGLLYSINHFNIKMIKYILSWQNIDGTDNFSLNNYLKNPNIYQNFIHMYAYKPNKALIILELLLKDGRTNPLLHYKETEAIKLLINSSNIHYKKNLNPVVLKIIYKIYKKF